MVYFNFSDKIKMNLIIKRFISNKINDKKEKKIEQLRLHIKGY